jgi:sirohydrochlorin ferrochelatase
VSGGAVVLAAHGSASDDRVNAEVCALADRVAATGRFAEVVASFHRGVPHYSTVLDQLQSSRATVIPFMTSGGYYCDEVLPCELARNRRFAEMTVRVTKPVGAHPKMARIAADRATALALEHGVAFDETSLLVVGHGTKRHSQSRDATIALARTLGQRLGVVESLPCFLEDDPTIEQARRGARGRNILAIVFLLTDGPHARRDVASALSLQPSQNDRPPYVGRCDDRFIVCDAAIGTDPAMSKLVIDLAMMESVCQAVRREVVA